MSCHNYTFCLQTYVELRNLSSVSRRLKVLPPQTNYFSISLGKK